MGTMVKYFPRPVVVGFTNGIAVLIASTQIRDLFGLRIDSVPSDFLPRAETLLAHGGTWSPAATALAAGTLAAWVIAVSILDVPFTFDAQAAFVTVAGGGAATLLFGLIGALGALGSRPARRLRSA